MSTFETGKVSEALSVIERELSALWSPEDGAPPKSRVCAANVVVLFGHGKRELAQLTIASMRSADVSRTMAVALDPHLPPWVIEAGVSALCQRDGEGLLCSERIDVTLGAGLLPRASSIVTTLSVAEVPTVLVLLDGAPRGLSKALLPCASRVVFDSEQMGHERARELLESSSAMAIDLSWLRLYPVRNQIAACFDDVMTRPAVMGIHRVKITTSMTEAASTAPSARLLVGWLASRLGWRLIGPTQATDALHGMVDIELAWRLAPEEPAGSTLGVEIDATINDATLSLRLEREPGEALLRVTRELEGQQTVAHTVPVTRAGLAEQLDEALAQVGSDRVLRQALAAAERAGTPPPPRND